MIIKTYPSLRSQATTAPSSPVPPPYTGRVPTPSDRHKASVFGITPEEFVRRDDIVHQMYLDCSFFVGDVLEPITEYGRNTYGKCTLKKAFRTYHDFPVNQAKDWPDDDRPLILTVEPELDKDKNPLIICAPDYLRRPKYITQIGSGTC